MPRGADAVVMIEHDRIDRRRRAGHRIAPRRRARAVRLLCRLRHRARRDAAAPRRPHRLARDRHAGGLRAGRGRGGAAADRGGAVDRRRAGRAGRAARSPPASTTATAPSSPPPCRKPAACRSRSAPFPTTRRRWKRRCAARLREADMVVLSGGTSKGAGDLSHTIVSALGPPGIVVHGVALKPGKPLCLAVVGDKPIVVLPGFPTSAIFTFHAFVAPVIRARAGLPPEAAETLTATRAGARCLRTRAARNSCWCRWSKARRAPSPFRPARAPAR